jgi:hypothetical protein
MAGWAGALLDCNMKLMMQRAQCCGFYRLTHPIRCRRISEADVAHVLAHGIINRRLSKFGGKPSPMFALEGPAAAALMADGEEAGEAAEREAAAASGRPAAEAAGSALRPLGSPAPGRSQRMLRVLYAANDNATVVLTAIDLQGGEGG